MTVKLKITMKVEVPGMQMVQCKCHSCGSELNLDLDNLQAYCPACGSKLLIDMDMLGQIMIEREKNKTEQLRIEKNAEIEKEKIEKEKQDGKMAVLIVTIIFGFWIIMILIGSLL